MPMIIETKLSPIDTEVVVTLPTDCVILPGVVNHFGRLAFCISRPSLHDTGHLVYEPRLVRCVQNGALCPEGDDWMPLGPVLYESRVLYVFVALSSDPAD
jgi:hypothetical protein